MKHLDDFVRDIGTIFHPDHFNRSRLPATTDISTSFETIALLPSCLDMLILLPSGDLTLPEPYASDESLMRLLSQIIAFENNVLPGWRDDRYLYLTVDTRNVEPGQTHRNAGWHFDGMQGSRYPQKLPACHQYVVCSGPVTEYSSHPVDASSLDENKDNWFEHLGAQIPADAPVWRSKPGELCVMSAYQLHRSPIVEHPVRRTFVRVDVSCKQQDRLGNTPNPAIDIPFDYVERKLPPGLSRPVSDSSWKGSDRFHGDK